MASDTNLNLIDYETKVKIKDYLNLLFQKKYFISVKNKAIRLSRNNATIIDHINTNHFLNNDMHSGVITADISDHFPVFVFSKYLKLVSAIFYQIFVFPQNNSPFKTMKSVFYFVKKNSFCSRDIHTFVIFSLPFQTFQVKKDK